MIVLVVLPARAPGVEPLEEVDEMRQSAWVVIVVASAASTSVESALAAEPAEASPQLLVPSAAEVYLAQVLASRAHPAQPSVYTPPPCVGLFPDVSCSSPYAPWIEQLYRDRITTGCGGGLYCPDAAVTRSQMAVFLERLGRGSERWPPQIIDVFTVLNNSGYPDPVASGQALLAAIASIPAKGISAPSLDNQIVVRVGPGSYSLQGAQLTLPGWVHLHGEGRYITRITSMASAPESIRLLGFTEIKELSIEFNALASSAVAVVVEPSAGLRLIDAEIFADATATVGVGIAASSSSVTVERSRVIGQFLSGSAWGIYAAGTGSRNLNVHDSFLWGTSHAVYASGSYWISIDDTMLYGALYKGATATYKCRETYTNTFATVTCP